MIARTMLAALIGGLIALPASTNDGFGGLTATGLTFGQTGAVAMEEEDLFIGLDRITVDYVFRNITGTDVTGEVIFPLPPASVSGMMEYDWNLPEDRDRANLVNFTVTVDGVDMPFRIDRIAVIETPWEEGRPLAERYDTPGRDVTADLERLGIPLSLDSGKVVAAFGNLDADARAELEALGLAMFYDNGAGGQDPFPLWSIVVRYHWTQTFPAGQPVRISHTYENRPSGGVFEWSDPPKDYMTTLADQYCIDAGTSRALERALQVKADDGATYSVGLAYHIAYVLRTANSWAGPIGKFRLTLDKGAPGNVISLCAEGVKKTGPTTFVIEKTDYTPDRDLEILVAIPATF